MWVSSQQLWYQFPFGVYLGRSWRTSELWGFCCCFVLFLFYFFLKSRGRSNYTISMWLPKTHNLIISQYFMIPLLMSFDARISLSCTLVAMSWLIQQCVTLSSIVTTWGCFKVRVATQLTTLWLDVDEQNLRQTSSHIKHPLSKHSLTSELVAFMIICQIWMCSRSILWEFWTPSCTRYSWRPSWSFFNVPGWAQDSWGL